MATIKLRKKYLTGPDGNESKNIPWKKGGRGGLHGSNHSGKKRTKGSRHPIGLSGRTCGELIRSFKEGR